MKPLFGIVLATLLSLAGYAQAKVKVALLSTEFVLAHKLVLLEEAAREQGVELAWVQVDRQDAGRLRQALEGADRALIDSPRPDDQAAVEAAAGGAPRPLGAAAAPVHR